MGTAAPTLRLMLCSHLGAPPARGMRGGRGDGERLGHGAVLGVCGSSPFPVLLILTHIIYRVNAQCSDAVPDVVPNSSPHHVPSQRWWCPGPGHTEVPLIGVTPGMTLMPAGTDFSVCLIHSEYHSHPTGSIQNPN